MHGQTAKHAGIALAAVLQGDRALAKAGPGLARALTHDRPFATVPSDADGRRRHLGTLLEQVRPRLDGGMAGLPPRLLALVARRLPAEGARELLRSSPPPRSGFTLTAGLVSVLMRIARHHQEHAQP